MSSPSTPKLITPLTPLVDYFSFTEKASDSTKPVDKGDHEDIPMVEVGELTMPSSLIDETEASEGIPQRPKSGKTISFSPALEIIDLTPPEERKPFYLGEGGVGSQEDGAGTEDISGSQDGTTGWDTSLGYQSGMNFGEDDWETVGTTWKSSLDPSSIEPTSPVEALITSKPHPTTSAKGIPSPLPNGMGMGMGNGKGMGNGDSHPIVSPMWPPNPNKDQTSSPPISETWATSSLQPALKAHLALLHPATPPEILSFISTRLISPDRPFGHEGSWRPIWKNCGDLLTAGVGFEAGKGVQQVGPGKEEDRKLDLMYGVARRSWRLLEMKSPGVDKI